MPPEHTHNRGSLNRLTKHSLDLFPGPTLFEKLARTLCEVGCLPRKELYEAWEMAKRVRRRFKGGRVIDLACGHGLLAYAMLLLDSKSEQAVGVDRRLTACGEKIAQALEVQWPNLKDRLTFIEADLSSIELSNQDLVVSAHACGELTDVILERAVEAKARVAVLPCCHSFRKQDSGGYDAWLEGSMAIDVQRVARLREQAYSVRMLSIPSEVTPKNRLIIGEPN